MITCSECSRTRDDGSGETGTSWICEDCKVSVEKRERQKDPSEGTHDPENGEAAGC